MTDEHGEALSLKREDGHTSMLDEEGEVIFKLPGTHTWRTMRAVLDVRNQAWRDGERFGRRIIAAELRRLIGAKEGE